MLKAIKTLVDSDYNMTVGNHAVIHAEMDIRLFTYFGNTVCVVNDQTRAFYVDDCGYSKSPSTTRALNDYKRHFTGIGYTETNKPT